MEKNDPYSLKNNQNIELLWQKKVPGQSDGYQTVFSQSKYSP